MCTYFWAALYLRSPHTRVPPPAPRVSRLPSCNIVTYRQNSQCVLFIIWEWLLLMQSRFIRIVGIKMPLKFPIDCCNISMVALFQIRNADCFMIDIKPSFVDFWRLDVSEYFVCNSALLWFFTTAFSCPKCEPQTCGLKTFISCLTTPKQRFLALSWGKFWGTVSLAKWATFKKLR